MSTLISVGILVPKQHLPGTSFEERGNDEACSGGKYFFSQRSWTQVTLGILGSVYEDIIEDTQMLHGAAGRYLQKFLDRTKVSVSFESP